VRSLTVGPVWILDVDLHRMVRRRITTCRCLKKVKGGKQGQESLDYSSAINEGVSTEKESRAYTVNFTKTLEAFSRKGVYKISAVRERFNINGVARWRTEITPLRCDSQKKPLLDSFLPTVLTNLAEKNPPKTTPM